MNDQTHSPSKRGRPGITYEQVVAGIETLKKQNMRVNQRNLVALIGGGAAKVQEHLNTYRSSHDQQIVVNATLPEAMQRVILAEMTKSNNEAVAETQKQLSEARNDLESMVDENNRQQSEIEQLEAANSDLQGEVQRQVGTIGQLQIEMAAVAESARGAREAAEIARHEKAIADTRLEVVPKLEHELAKVSAVVDAERGAAAAAAQRAAVAEATLAEMAQRLEDAKAREQLSANLARQHEQASERQARELAQANARIEAVNARLESAAREIESANKSASAARESARVAGEIAAELRGQLAALSANKATPAKRKKPAPKAEGATGP